MDFLNKSFAQVSDLFKSMSAGARITSGLLLVVIVISLGYLFNYPMSGGNDDLMNGEPVRPEELNAMLGALGKAGLTYEVEGNRVRIPRGQQAKYMAALADAGVLPAHFGDYLTKALNDGGPFDPKQKQEERWKIGKQKELTSIICKMNGIESAAVFYDAEVKSGIKRERLSTASVSVKPVGTQPLEEQRVAAIRHLVAAAFAGLKPEGVALIDMNGPTYPATSGKSGSGGLDDAYASTKRKYEQDWEAKILKALSGIAGVTVSANVELDPETLHREEKVQLEPKPVTIMRREQSVSSNREGSAPAGRPGLAAQGNQPASIAGAAKGSLETEDKTDTEEQNAASTNRTLIEQAGLTPKRASVTVSVPSSYYVKVWQERNPTPEGQTPKTPTKVDLDQIEAEVTATIRKTAANLITVPAGVTDPVSLVAVSTFQSLAQPEIAGPSARDNALAWLGQYWGTLGMAGLALVSLVMLRSTVRSGPSAPEPAPRPAPTVVSMTVEGEEEQPAGQTFKQRLKRRGLNGPTLRDELAEIVREDPDAAANILRTWIGKAS
ncbi:MAG: flagellar M-ring protein FliF C-terminal domain-containing protein [Pirellulales bacterium]|jgi:flagellar M-ring protein FliF